MTNVSIFQFNPQRKVFPVSLNQKPIRHYQHPTNKQILPSQIMMNAPQNYNQNFKRDFIPVSLTVPHINQIKPQVTQINPINITPFQQRNNIIPQNNNNSIIVSNVQNMPKVFNQGSIVINKQLPPRIVQPIVTNNNIISNQNLMKPNIINQVPVSNINMGNNITRINNINNFNYNNIPQPQPNINLNRYVQYAPPKNIINTNSISTMTSTASTTTSSFPYQNVNINPGIQLNLKEFDLLGEIGKGSFGKIYKVRWKVNQKLYALKNEILDNSERINNRLERGKAMRNFVQTTGCQGVVNIYGSYLIKYGNDFHYYELMDLCNTDFEKEIKMRSNYGSYYSEGELDNIIKQLISTLSLLQKQHITHRDIKPQNILIANGRYKLCDFGDIRVIQKNGDVLQRIRGSELYMSPILFYALRRGVQNVFHNTYKSDVFSLGMCLFYAACLSFDGPVEIREVSNMNIKAQILNKYLGARYSQKLIKILNLMLLTEEGDRPDFIMLEDAIMKYGL